ncbi:MAG: hypothetical protein MJ094_08235 [Saccharofermentans sp.]|nr:hypothetical protein [Saccharofermentans sp.]
MDNQLLPIGKVSKYVLIVLRCILATWDIVQLVSYIVDIVNECNEHNLSLAEIMDLNNVIGIVLTVGYIALHIVVLFLLFKDQLTALKIGIITIIFVSTNLVSMVDSVMKIYGSGYGIPVNLIVVEGVRFILFVSCVSFIFLSKRRWLGFHITYYIVMLINIYARLEAFGYNSGHMSTALLVNYIFSALFNALMIYEAVLVLIKSKTSKSQCQGQ